MTDTTETDDLDWPDGSSDLDAELLRDDVSALRDGAGMPNAALLAEAAQMGGAHLAGLAERLKEAEDLLQFADRALRVSQPPVPGKIAVRWWKLRGGEDMRMPVLVTWHPVHGGRRWRAKKLRQVRRDRINTKGTSALCADETYDLARAADQLIRRYGELRKLLMSELRRLKACHENTTDALGAIRSVIRFNHSMTVKKLLKAGYEVDRDTVDLPLKYLLD